MKKTFNYIDADNVICTSKLNGFSVIVMLPRSWLGKKIICRLAEEQEKSSSPKQGITSL